MTRAEQKRQPHSVIYALTEFGQPASPEHVRYIGRTVQLPLERLRKHLVTTRLHNSYHCHAWIRKLALSGIAIQMHVLMIVAHEDSCDFERRAIAHFKERGARLTNHTDGGDGQLSRPMSETTRLKMAASHKGKKLSAEHRAKLQVVLKRIAALPQTIEARKQFAKHGLHTADVNEKRRIALTGRRLSPETKAKVSAALTGRKQSASTKQKRAESIRLTKIAHGPYVVSDATKEKMRQSALLRHAKVRADGR